MTDLGLGLFGELEGEEDVGGEDIINMEKTLSDETSPLALDTFAPQEGSLPLDLFGTQQDQKTGGSKVERSVEPPDTDDKDFEFFDPFIKTPIALGFGMASWPFAQAARFGAIGGQKVQQSLGIVPEMTDEEITDLGNQTAEWVSTLGGNLDPQSDIGKSAMNLAGQAVEPITMAAHWINSGIDREKYPHLGPLADTLTEGMMFAFLHKFGKESIDIGKRQLKVREKKGQAKIRAQKKLEKKQAEVLAKAEEAARKGELQETINEYQEAIIPIVKEQTAGQPPTGQAIRTQAERAQAERLARQELSPEQQPGRVAREAERFQEGLIPDRRSLTEQSQLDRGFEGDIRRPDLGREPETGLDPLTQPEPAPKAEVTMLTEEGIPRATYQVENGKIKTVEKVGEKSTHQVNPETGKVELVESIPGQRSVYQIALDPLKNERGSVDLSFLNEKGKRFLKGSQVVGTRGNPKPMFHMALDTAVIEAGFKPDKSPEMGIHFGTENQVKRIGSFDPKITASKRKLGIPVLMNIKNPVRLDDRTGNWKPHNVLVQLNELGIVNDLEYNQINKKFQSNIDKLNRFRSDKIDPENGKVLRKVLLEKGYDGIVYANKFESPFEKGFEGIEGKRVLEDSFIAFKPEQVKSVFDKNIWKDKKNAPKEPSQSNSLVVSLLDPLRNDSGAITIPGSRKRLLQETTPTFRENVRKFGELAAQAGIPLKDFLKNNDFTKKEIKQIIKVSEAVKLDRPMASAKEMPVTNAKDFKITELEKGDTQINIGKDANPNIKFGLKDLKKFAQIPKLKSGGLVQGLTVPETFFTKHKSLKPLLHMKRARDKALAKDTKVLTNVFKDIEKTYSDKKLRKEAGALQISKGKFGEKAMDKMGVKVNPDAKYQGLSAEIQPILQDGLRRINEVRKMNNRKPIKEMDDFIAWFAEESLWRDVKELVGGDFNKQGPSLVHDSLESIKSRHTQAALDMGNFNHVTREGLRDGVKLELDPLVIAQRYMSELLPVIHYAELNSFIKEAMTKDLTLPNGKKINFSDKYRGINQGLAQELISWSNSLVGKGNSPLPHLVEKQLGKLRRNLTNATLVGNIRTTAIQLTALQTSFVERPGRTIQAGFDFMADLGRKKPKFDRDKYNSLPDKSVGLAAMDASFSDASSAIGGTKLQKGSVAARNTLAWGMKQLDYVAREITARAKESELKKAVEEGRISEKEMIEQVDSTVVRTQSSGARGEVAPIQRSELGKIMTLWQTFTIGHINWLAKEVLGVKNPELTPVKTANRVFRYVATTSLLGYVFEDLIGIQAPGPAPIQSIKRQIQGGEKDLFKIALETGKELSELVPFGSSIKFGSSVYGPVADFINKDLVGLVSNSDIYNKDTLAKARKGDVKSIIKILEVSGKLTGVPGTAQVAKTARGLLRNESLMRAMIGRIFDENAGVAGKKRKRIKRKRTSSQRRTR